MQLTKLSLFLKYSQSGGQTSLVLSKGTQISFYSLKSTAYNNDIKNTKRGNWDHSCIGGDVFDVLQIRVAINKM